MVRILHLLTQTADATDEFVNTNLPRRSPEQHKGHQDLNTDIKSAQEAVQVTFGEPLESMSLIFGICQRHQHLLSCDICQITRKNNFMFSKDQGVLLNYHHFKFSIIRLLGSKIKCQNVIKNC